MPAIVVTGVNTGTDVITAVAHGLTTGDRFRFRNVGGALPAATPALAGATDYFSVVTGVDTLKVSDTNAHALAGTGIVDLTGSGSGTTTVEYGLPYCIPTALAAAGTQIKSANDNGTWNALVALYCFLTAQTQTVLSSVTLAANQDVSISGTGRYKHGTRTLQLPVNNIATSAGIVGDDFGFTAGTNGWIGAIPLPVGKRITAIRCRIKDSVTGPTTVRGRLYSSTDGTPSAALGTTNTSSGSGAAQTLSATSLAVTIAALTTYRIVVDGVAGTQLCHLYSVEVDFDELV